MQNLDQISQKVCCYKFYEEAYVSYHIELFCPVLVVHWDGLGQKSNFNHAATCCKKWYRCIEFKKDLKLHSQL